MSFFTNTYYIRKPDELNNRLFFYDSGRRMLTIQPADVISESFKSGFSGGNLDFEYLKIDGCSWLYDIKWNGETITIYD
jgi:hypothetical protein